MAKIDCGEKLIANMKEHSVTLIFLMLWVLLPYLLMGGGTVLWDKKWSDIPFWKILDIFSKWMNNHVWNVINLTATWMPPIIVSLITFIAYLMALILNVFLLMKMFKLIWPKTDENGQYNIEQ